MEGVGVMAHVFCFWGGLVVFFFFRGRGSLLFEGWGVLVGGMIARYERVLRIF